MPQNYVRTFCGGLYFQSKLVPCRGHVITCFKGWLIVQKEHVKQGYQDENRRNSEIFSHTLPYNRCKALLLCDKKKIYNFKYHFHKPFSLSLSLSLFLSTHLHIHITCFPLLVCLFRIVRWGLDYLLPFSQLSWHSLYHIHFMWLILRIQNRPNNQRDCKNRNGHPTYV